jgi:putative ABC transport system permease protein
MRNWLQDVRYSFRKLSQSLGITAIAVLALGLGIGANSAIFSVVNTTLLRPLPFKDPDQLVMVWENNLKKGVNQIALSPANYADFRDQSQSFSAMAAMRPANFTVTGGDEPERVPGAMVTPNLFTLFDVRTVVGRAFLPEEAQPGSDAVVLISHGLWQRRFASDANVVGRQLKINGRDYQVVGVVPPDFRLSQRADLWTPLALGPKEAVDRAVGSLAVIGRLKPGVSVERAESEMSAIAGHLREQYPDTNADHGIRLVSLHEQLVGDIRLALFVLLGSVGFVLLIACVNVANLLMARAASRQKEMALRTALGASRWRLARQLLTESVMLAISGGILGLFIAYGGIGLLVAGIPDSIPRAQESGIDLRVLAFTLGVSVLMGIVFGLAPALQGSKANLNETLKEGGRSASAGSGGRRLRGILVVAETALALVLLVCAGLMIQSFVRLQEVDPGFNPSGLLTMQMTLPPSKYAEPHQQTAFYDDLLERVRNTPGVQSAGLVTTLPLSGANNIVTSFVIEGSAAASPGQDLTADYRVTSPDYFRTMGIPVQRGAIFTRQDTAQSPPKAVINETMARRYFASQEPVGSRITVDVPPKLVTFQIVGVVGDVRHFGLDRDAKPEFYVSYLQQPWPAMTLAAKVGGDPLKMAPAVRGKVIEVDKDQPVFNVRDMNQIMAESVAQPRLTMFVLGLFAAVALLLAGMGVYGVMAYSVTQRKHEMGLRMALGARPSHILKLVVRQGMLLTLIGVVIGLALAIAATRLLSSLLYGVSATDPLTFVSVSLVLSLVALLACYLPARRAMRVDPIIALRQP